MGTFLPVQLVSLRPRYQPVTPLASRSHRTEHASFIGHNFREIPRNVNRICAMHTARSVWSSRNNAAISVALRTSPDSLSHF